MKVTLELDGKEIGMNDYVQRILGEVVFTIVGTLKGLPEDWDETVVRIEEGAEKSEDYSCLTDERQLCTLNFSE